MSDKHPKPARPLKADGKEGPKRSRRADKSQRQASQRTTPRIIVAAQESGRDLAALRAQVTATILDIIARRYLPPAPNGEPA
ncbi:MAG: hypothetical protein U0164_12500 [Gemmatimonadaceae bacterium]